MLDQVITAAGRFTEECSGLIETVGRIGGGEFLAGERSECSEKIDLAYERIRNARAHARRPAHEQRHARAGFEAAIFTPAKLRGGTMVAEFFHGAVLVTVIEDGAIVAAEQD